MGRSPRILIIRRDNIGDLICTTPLIRALREQLPEAYIAVLASSYNVSVLDGNPDVDDVFVFLKRQQKSHGHSQIATLWKRWQLLQQLRRCRFDHVLLANGGWRYGRQLGGRQTIGFRERDNAEHRQPDVIVALANRGRDDHEVMKMARLGAALGIDDALGAARVFPDMVRVAATSARLAALGWQAARPTIALHISSRQPVQRWPEASFVEFARRLLHDTPFQLLLLWAPGAENDPMHPGDDGKAATILAALQGLPVYACPTHSVPDLVAALSLSEQMICSDGGAMHVAAGLGKPILCFFGHSNAREWHPWHVPYVLLQPESRVVADIGVDAALAAFRELQERVSHYFERTHLSMAVDDGHCLVSVCPERVFAASTTRQPANAIEMLARPPTQ
jgi:ADP-heptose:LPS heptosyltransferase